MLEIYSWTVDTVYYARVDQLKEDQSNIPKRRTRIKETIRRRYRRDKRSRQFEASPSQRCHNGEYDFCQTPL